MENLPNYYSILPAVIRYDNSLTDGEKILYSEITALSNKNGVCTAPNSYFAKLYKVVPETISRRVSKLVKKGYITIEFEYNSGTKEIEKRLIKIVDSNIVLRPDKNNEEVLTNSSIPIDENIKGGIDKKVKVNNTSSNIKRKYNKRKSNKRKLTPKKTYGPLENVFLTADELDKLKQKFPNNYDDKIETLSLYMSSHGKKYSNHYATILTWDRTEKKKKEEANYHKEAQNRINYAKL